MSVDLDIAVQRWLLIHDQNIALITISLHLTWVSFNPGIVHLEVDPNCSHGYSIRLVRLRAWKIGRFGCPKKQLLPLSLLQAFLSIVPASWFPDLKFRNPSVAPPTWKRNPEKGWICFKQPSRFNSWIEYSICINIIYNIYYINLKNNIY